jgi:hypothetical protein
MRSAPAPPEHGARGHLVTRAWRGVLCALLLLAVTVPAHAQREQSLRVTPLVKDDKVLVSLQLTDGMTDEVWAAIRSGLRTTFTYSVDLRVDARLWWDRKIETTTVAISVDYDNLTRTYRVSRSIDGREVAGAPSANEDTVREWMTSLVREPLFDPAQLQPNRAYYVGVSATARPTGGSILGWLGSGVSGQARFTFIP